MNQATRLTDRFTEAVAFAAELHATQLRKGTPVPYLAHLLAVCSLVLEDGGDEDQAIAALLHDAVEDQGGPPTLAEIRRRFGDRVAMIVEGCTDADTIPKPPWQTRKEQYIARLTHEPAEVLRVSVADKLHNARSMVADLRRDGNTMWSKFNSTRDQNLWYYRSLVAAYRQAHFPSPLVDALDRTVAEIAHLSEG
jgi:(p)ppGpp synthase/HD superfamily hydrolase